MRLGETRVVSTGPALGEIITEGALFDEQEKVLALFRQRFRAWLGRPLLELRIELRLQHQPEGYPWHAYYGARFAWRDERATVVRGVNGTGCVTSATRPDTPDYLELRSSRHSTLLFPGGLPFHQRHGGRMVDVILAPEGEKTLDFELGLGLDRDYPMQTAIGMVTPCPVVTTAKGPPHVGSSAWLFHLDAPNLLLTGLRPAADGADAITARLLEVSGSSGQAELRCARSPRKATVVDGQGAPLSEARVEEDKVMLEFSSSELLQVRIDFE
jgi:hypothetical protein